MTLSEIRNILNDEDIMLTKSLGQTFMHDQNQLRKIVALAKLAPDDSVIEIGPGLGPLTGMLLEIVGHVTAIETDRRLIKLLEERLGQRENLTLQHADAMKIVRKTEFDWSGHKLVANLPYSIASPLLIDLAESPCRPRAMIVTLQLEVVQRMLAKPGTKEYGVLALLIGLHYAAGEWFTIPRGSFYPEPNVDSGCIELLRRETPSAASGAVPGFQKNRQARLRRAPQKDDEATQARLARSRRCGGIRRAWPRRKNPSRAGHPRAIHRAHPTPKPRRD